MRSGRPIEAIDVYLKILSAHPIYKLISQFKLLFRDKPDFLGFTDLDEEEYQNFDRSNRKKQTQMLRQDRHFIPDSIVEFDE